jgi:hypothetical protein
MPSTAATPYIEMPDAHALATAVLGSMAVEVCPGGLVRK